VRACARRRGEGKIRRPSGNGSKRESDYDVNRDNRRIRRKGHIHDMKKTRKEQSRAGAKRSIALSPDAKRRAERSRGRAPAGGKKLRERGGRLGIRRFPRSSTKRGVNKLVRQRISVEGPLEKESLRRTTRPCIRAQGRLRVMQKENRTPKGT